MKERSRSKTQMPASKKKISRGEYVLKLENQEKIFTIKDCLTKDRLQELDVDETYDAKKILLVCLVELIQGWYTEVICETINSDTDC